MNVDFVLNYCGFIFFFFLYLYSDDLKIVLFAVCVICMSLALCERFKRAVSLCYTGES